MSCHLEYIPVHLYQEEHKPLLKKFAVEDILYRRCAPELLQNPYKAKTPVELSHNLGTVLGNFLSHRRDVLWSIKEEESFKRYNESICTLTIKLLREDGSYYKEFEQQKNGMNYRCVMQLIHDPEPCMYPHCIFRIWINGELITTANSNQTINKLKVIKRLVKQELARMIITREIRQ
jgi:hypothetical protein